MNMKAKKLLTLVFFSVICFGVGAKVAKKEVKPAILPAQTEEVKKESHHHCHGFQLLGKHFTKTQKSYESLADKDLYVVFFEDDTFAIYKKGVTDMEGIASDKEVTFIELVKE
ncbi:hypothetical protein CFPG_P2-25 (plasmid) [Candidatus Azobacteroides pseudotrichonymphae genomovar. CFP2]|uniref:Uncharacterized protein n=2 Tax=Candidatus Azobacteroides TaxID=511434 RepID=B6YSB1_AZOPC|nr:hypothetical protein CFPG_P2-25 [Candidatus Azobacteroides pseudotrichonymphae genomovar. CFP2]